MPISCHWRFAIIALRFRKKGFGRNVGEEITNISSKWCSCVKVPPTWPPWRTMQTTACIRALTTQLYISHIMVSTAVLFTYNMRLRRKYGRYFSRFQFFRPSFRTKFAHWLSLMIIQSFSRPIKRQPQPTFAPLCFQWAAFYPKCHQVWDY